MAIKYQQLNKELIEFIRKQSLFFVGTAADVGRLNISPKGLDSFRVINENKVIWLNLTGSGNETAAHVINNSRMTIMFCSFDKQPLILRLYGHAKVIHPRDKAWQDYVGLFDEQVGARQIFDLDIDLVQGSCGFSIPYMAYQGERDTLTKHFEKRSQKELEQYWAERNQLTIDGLPTNIIDK